MLTLDDDTLAALLLRADAVRGLRVPVRGPETHKGRIGDAVERLVLGRQHTGKSADHPAAELKSVPVEGERVVERCKLGILSVRSNPLEKCERILFVFVEVRGQDAFVAGHALVEFQPAAWLALWRSGHLVETAAGVSGLETRGLYLTPRFFHDHGHWPR
ncbi:MAG: hypothetical protein ABI321_08880 [Polyangia bacterium]